MIDFPFLYRATLFTYTIKPEQENVLRIQKLFEDKGLLPSMFQEISNGTPVMRFEMISPNEDWRIRFQEQRIDIVKSINFNDFAKISTEQVFSSLVIECLQRIISEFNYKAFRLAFSAIYILKEAADTKAVFHKLIHPCDLFSMNQPIEWNFRNVFRINKDINKKNSVLNYCFDANVGTVESSQPGVFKSERIFFTTDINSMQEETINYKFDIEDINDFFKQVICWNTELKESYCKLLE